MPEQRLQRTRATLPEGYRFGDGGGGYVLCRVTVMDRRDIVHPGGTARIPARFLQTSSAYRITQAQLQHDLHAGEE